MNVTCTLQLYYFIEISGSVIYLMPTGTKLKVTNAVELLKGDSNEKFKIKL
jgi:hypothetical protein